ncbi:cyclic AMP-dependent transcription factor ATF-6 beta-like isoform X1 [Lampetra fluviatilis]
MESFLAPNHLGVDDWEMGNFDLEEEMDLNELNDIFRALKRDMELEEDVELDMEALAAAAVDVAEPWSDIYKQIFTDTEVKEEKEEPVASSPDSRCLGSPASIGPLGPEDVKGESGPPTPPTLPGDVPCPSPLPTVAGSSATAAIAALRPEEPRGSAARTGGPLLLPRCPGLSGAGPAGPAGTVPPLPVLLTPVPLLTPATAGPRCTATHSIAATAMGPAARTVVLRCPSQLLAPAGSSVVAVPLPITTRNVVVPASASAAKPIVPAPAASIPSAPAGADERVWRRQQRMMKNRESACQSRARKRQQLQQLQGQLQAALVENAALRRENVALRNQLAQLLALAQGGGGGAARTTKAVCAMALLAFIVLGYGPLGLGPLGEAPHSPAPHPRLLPPLPGRKLLGYEERAQPPPSTPPTEAQRPHSRARWADSELVLRRDDQVVILPQSCIQLNSSEILRLSGELHGWILRHERQRNRTVLTPAARSTPPRRSQRRSPPLIPPTAPTDNSAERALSSQLQVPGEWRWRQSWDFLELIGRRDDTFYVVSFRRDHLLLPARAHNHTRRPRMSLLMPAMAQHNDSVVQEDVGESMMQIDCEVTNTRLLHAKTRTTPSSSPPSSASSSPPPSSPPPSSSSSSLHTARGRG